MSDIEPLTIIDCSNAPLSYSQHPCRIHFEVTDTTEISGEKAKKLVEQLKIRLKHFKGKWGTISCSLTELDEFSVAQVSEKKIKGVWHSAKFEAVDTDPSSNVRSRNYGKIVLLINKELLTWSFLHYKTILKIQSCESK